MNVTTGTRNVTIRTINVMTGNSAKFKHNNYNIYIFEYFGPGLMISRQEPVKIQYKMSNFIQMKFEFVGNKIIVSNSYNWISQV